MDKKKIIILLGKTLAQTQVGNLVITGVSILALIFGIIPNGDIQKYFNLDSPEKIFRYILIVVVVTISLVLGTRYFGEWLISLGKSIRPKIKIVPLDPPDQESIWVDRKWITSSFASLNIINNEDTELTECYAILKNGQPGSLPKEVHDWLGRGTKKSSWKSTKGSFITIGSWNGEEILHIYMVSYNVHDHKLLSSKFCICDDDMVRQSPSVGYTFSIELNGKLNGESIKPIPFHGYFDLSIQITEDAFNLSGLTIHEGENKDKKIAIAKPTIKVVDAPLKGKNEKEKRKTTKGTKKRSPH